MNVEKSHIDGLRIDRSREREGNRLIPAVIAATIVVIAIAVAFVFLRPAPATVVVANVEEIRTTSQPATVLNASGYVTARRQATVSSKITGRVTEVLIEEGMEVRQGQLLARLDAATSSAALRLALAQQQSAISALEETRVRIAEARLDLERASRLASEQISSRAEADRAEAQLKALQARLAAQQTDLGVAASHVGMRRQDLEDSEIRAPFSGIVISKNAQPGEMISPMSAGGFTRTGICTIVDMESLEIEVDVNEAYINRVQSGQRVEAVLDAYPDWRIPAHVITVVPTADRQKATVRVRIGFDERDPRVLPDMGIKVAFIQPQDGVQIGSGVQIPRAALRRDGEQDIVFVAQGGRVERRAVSVASADADRARLSAGLSAGESVVVSGPQSLSDGDRVRIAKENER